MENLALIIPTNPITIPTKQWIGLPNLPKKQTGLLFVSKPIPKTVVFAFTTRNSRRSVSHNRNNHHNVSSSVNGVEVFTNNSNGQEITSVGVNQQPYVLPPSSQFGPPLFWIGVGVGFYALFSSGASWLKKYAMQQAFKTMMGQMGSQNNHFSTAAFPSNSPFGFPPPSTSAPTTFPDFPYQPPSKSRPSTYNGAPSSPAASITIGVSANKPEVTEPDFNDEKETAAEENQSDFTDISPEETLQTSPFENYDDTASWRASEAVKFTDNVVQNESVSNEGTSEWSQEKRESGSLLSVEDLEKLLDDPNIQKMVYPYLPEEQRNPATFKWMLQNPLFRQRLQETSYNIGNVSFDIHKVEQMFTDEFGLSPQEAISRAMTNPDIAMAFANPKIQHALMDVSRNPTNIIKYQNDKEVMDFMNKLQELVPGICLM